MGTTDMSYELVLLGEQGAPKVIYATDCANDEAARRLILQIGIPYARYEIWRGMEKIAEGVRRIPAN